MKTIHIIALFSVILFCFLLTIPRLQSQPQEEKEAVIAEQPVDNATAAIAGLLKPYTDNDSERFLDRLTREYRPGYDMFGRRVSQTLRDKDDIDITYDIIAKNEQGDNLVVNVRWERRWRDRNSGAYEKNIGITTLTFIKTIDGYSLIDSAGDELF